MSRSQNKIIIDNDGWTKMVKSGKPPKITKKISNNCDEDDDEETKEIKKAIQLSLKTSNSYKSPEEREIEIAIKLSMEYDIMINSTSEFPTISGSLTVKPSKSSKSSKSNEDTIISGKSNKRYII